MTCSTKLARLHYQLKNAGLNTNVDFMNQMRDKGLDADFLAVMTYEKEDPVYETRDDLIGFLYYGSPKLRVLLAVVHQTCYVENSKLLVVEATFCRGDRIIRRGCHAMVPFVGLSWIAINRGHLNRGVSSSCCSSTCSFGGRRNPA